MTKFWTKLFFASVFIFSIGVYFGFIALEDTQNWVKVYKTAGMTFSSPLTYATITLICILFFLLDYAFLTHKFNIMTSLIDYLRFVIKHGK